MGASVGVPVLGVAGAPVDGAAGVEAFGSAFDGSGVPVVLVVVNPKTTEARPITRATRPTQKLDALRRAWPLPILLRPLVIGD